MSEELFTIATLDWQILNINFKALIVVACASNHRSAVNVQQGRRITFAL